MKAKQSDNTSAACSPTADGWISGNIIVDRDIYGEGDYGDYGISIAGGKVSFGISLSSFGVGICSTASVLDDNWHHIAVTRNS